MKHRELQPELVQPFALLRQRLRSLGIALLVCDDQGQVTLRAPAGEDWLTDLLCASPLFTADLGQACAAWADDDEPGAWTAIAGLWLCPIPIVSRRRRLGYAVAVICSDPLLQSEHLHAMCQAAKMDLQLCRSRLAKLPLASDREVGRLAAMVRFLSDDQSRLSANTRDMESVGRQLAESYEEMNLLYTIIANMTVQERPERFVATACQELLKTLSYAWIGMQLCEDRQRLKSLAGRLVIAGQPPAGHPSQLRQKAKELLEIAQPEAPMVLNPVLHAQHAAEGYAILGGNAVVQPVCSDGAVIGILIAGDKRGSDQAASSVDMKLLAATGTHMAIFLENAALYDDLNAMFLGTLEALTASIDAKDRYTCGHSRRVAHLTQQLAQAIGLDEYTVGRMHIAGLVHDVGKIGVPEAVLLKPGKLNQDEYAWIRRHPEIGHRILRDIPQLNDVLPGVLYHHERWDGRGYPEGLRGEAIPLVARLIGLADSFDAMSSTRTYRHALSRKQVLDEITKCIGAQFDPALARVFVKLDFTEFDRMVREHQAGGADAAGRPRLTAIAPGDVQRGKEAA